MSKHFSLLLSLSIIITSALFCFTANADEATQGSCGENAYWIYDEPSTTLTISGTGEMGEICFGEYEFGNEATRLVVEPGITSISTCAFDSCSALTDVSLPNTLTTICDGAFWGCESLRQIDIPSSVTQIQGGAFQYCTALENITLPDGITEIYPKTFSYCKNLKHIEIPNSVTSIGQYAFNNSGIVEITIPENVTIIDQEAFSFSALETLNIYSKELSVKQYAFKGSCLNEVNTNSIASWCGYSFFNSSSNPIYVSHNLYLNGELITDLVIPEGVTRVESVAFYSCENINAISFPSTLQSIGTSAFRRCKGLKSINIPSPIDNISSGAFLGCFQLTDVYYGGTQESFDSAIFEYPFEANATIHYLYNTHEHEYTAMVIPPTCSNQGYTLYKCSICGEAYETDYVDKLAHNYTAITTAPTCTTEGVTRYTCTNCSYEIVEYFECLPHYYVFVGCDSEFLKYECADCKKENTRHQSNLPSFDKYINVKVTRGDDGMYLDVVNDGFINAKDYAVIYHYCKSN